MIDALKSSFEKLFSKNTLEKKSYVFKSLTSTFKNIAQYDLESLDTARIHTKDIIPYNHKNQINYKREDVYSVIEVNNLLSQSLQIEYDTLSNTTYDEIILKSKSILEDRIIQSIDDMILFQMSELGRITASIYGQFKESIGTFTISLETTSESIINKLEYSDIVLKELNSVGLKHLIVSKIIYDKLQDFIKDYTIVINHKKVSVQVLPDYLDKSDQICLIATSQNPKELTPGIVIVYKNLILDIIKNEKNKTLDFHLSKEYSLQKVGKRPELFYLRFLQT